MIISPRYPLLFVPVFLVGFILCCLSSGCTAGKGKSATQIAHQGIDADSGRVFFQVAWPQVTRLIPPETQQIRVTLSRAANQPSTAEPTPKIIMRPDDTVVFSSLRTGRWHALAEALDGNGREVAAGTTDVDVRGGQSVQATVELQTTNPSNPGGTGGGVDSGNGNIERFKTCTYLRAQNEHLVFCIADGIRRAVPSPQWLQDVGVSETSIRVVRRDEIETYQLGLPIPHLVRPLGKSEVYWVRDRTKRWIRSQAIFEGMGFQGEDVLDVSSSTAEAYPSEEDVRQIEPNLVLVEGPVLGLYQPGDDLFYAAVGDHVSGAFRVKNLSRPLTSMGLRIIAGSDTFPEEYSPKNDPENPDEYIYDRSWQFFSGEDREVDAQVEGPKGVWHSIMRWGKNPEPPHVLRFDR